MSKYISLIFLSFICICAFFSCTKSTPLHPLPANYRLYSFSKLHQLNTQRSYTDKYTFSYNTNNQVSQIVFTSNDTSIPNQVIYFNYSHDSIYKSVYGVNNSHKIDSAIFIFNSYNQITESYEPYDTMHYSYFGKLLTKESYLSFSPYYDGISTLYYSANGDFYKSASQVSNDSTLVFNFYTDFNRTGDYLQLNAFCRYGYNFYQNDHLVKHMNSSGYTTDVTYVIDADNKITQTNATVVDSIGDVYTAQYNLQYITF